MSPAIHNPASADPHWFADDHFWRTLFPYIFPANRIADAAREVDSVLALAAPPGNRVLDLCCGPGRHAIELARRGFAVTGVDLSPFLLAQARERAKEAGAAVKWVAADMREFNADGTAQFDLALNMFSSLGFFETDAENNRTLATLHRSLAPGGLAMIEVISKEYLARDLKETLTTEYPDGSLLIARHWIEGAFERIRNQWLLIQDGVSQSFHFEHQLYTGVELRDRLLAVGFREVTLYGNLQGESLSRETTRVVAIARK